MKNLSTTRMKFEVTEKLPVERLRLDRSNPRLIGQDKNATDESIIARLYKSAELGELLHSISANGYLDIEPLVVIPVEKAEDLIVLEGNRRLAALRLLREPDLVHRIASTENLRIKVPSIKNSLRATLDEITVYPVAKREDARAFIGFKHINGPAKWDAYAKARYAARWYERGKNEGINLADIARAIGDRHDTIKRMVSAIYVLNQAKNKDLFDLKDRYSIKFNFSHLYTALARSQYMTFLGLESRWATYDPSPDPVRAEKLDKLQKLLIWIYGSKKEGQPPVIKTQNPDIKRLGEVLEHAQGLHVLETNGDLDEAHSSTEPVEKQFTTSLIHARRHIVEAASSLRAYDGKDKSLLDIAEDVKETAETVHARMLKKRREATLP